MMRTRSHDRLWPGLPRDVAPLMGAHMNPLQRMRMQLVCKAWHEVLTGDALDEFAAAWLKRHKPKTALRRAIEHGMLAVVARLIELGAEVSRPAVKLALRNIAVLRMLAANERCMEQMWKHRALHLAIEGGLSEACHVLAQRVRPEWKRCFVSPGLISLSCARAIWADAAEVADWKYIQTVFYKAPWPVLEFLLEQGVRPDDRTMEILFLSNQLVFDEVVAWLALADR